jgi:hypothetical protein
MATGKSAFQLLCHSTLALLLATTSAWGMGEPPPEGREPQAASCPDQKPGPCGPGAPAAGGATSGTASPDDPSNPDAKSRTSRPDRYGTGYETRKGLGSGGGGGRGRSGRGR